MDTVNFDLNSKPVSQWAGTAEFKAGKRIAILKFARLSKAKGETNSMYTNKNGETYRLTFIDLENGEAERKLEIWPDEFLVDLAASVRKEFGRSDIPVGQEVILRTYEEKKTDQKTGRTYLVNRWELKKLEENGIQRLPE